MLSHRNAKDSIYSTADSLATSEPSKPPALMPHNLLSNVIMPSPHSAFTHEPTAAPWVASTTVPTSDLFYLLGSAIFGAIAIGDLRTGNTLVRAASWKLPPRPLLHILARRYILH